MIFISVLNRIIRSLFVCAFQQLFQPSNSNNIFKNLKYCTFVVANVANHSFQQSPLTSKPFLELSFYWLSSELAVESNLKSMESLAKRLRSMSPSGSAVVEFVNSPGSEEERQWWLPGPPGPTSFMLLVHGPLLSELGLHGLSSGESLNGIGWVLDEGPMLAVALEGELNSG